ncbi:MAG: 7-cyano-7-deazaguanine synthase [Methanobacteriaceae archaeon]|nr:7-cyano-7-deazaguanine synthase [Candidatus Methanorudis spinitermitis]
MKFSKNELIKHIKRIRKEINHKDSEINIKELLFNDEKNELWIITLDRPDKSAIIGKGGWVVGKLKEKLNLNKIHVNSYSDYLLKKYQMDLSLIRLNSFISKYHREIIPLNNLKDFLEEKIKNIYNFDINSYFKNTKNIESKDHQAIVALSGGVDSSFSLILAKYLGFNPIAITVDPGTIILPNQFKYNIKKLCGKLNVQHQYLRVDYENIIKNSLDGKFHPCGRCSSNTEDTLFKFAAKKDIDIIIFGDMLSTGTQCIINTDTIFEKDKKINKSLARLNLPATLSIGKEEIKNLVNSYNLDIIKGFGCPLLFEVHKKYPYMKKFSIQRILRETRSGALEPGEALDLIWSFYKII